MKGIQFVEYIDIQIDKWVDKYDDQDFMYIASTQ